MIATSRLRRLRRDISAILVVGLFMLPLFWWLLASIKPISAQFDLAGNVVFDFVPTFDNYAATLFGFNPYEAAGFDMGENFFDSRQPLLSSTVIALCATALSLILSTPAAYALSRMTFRGRERFVGLILLQRLMPPIAIIVPTVYLMRDVKLYDTHVGIILVHSLMNLPVAVLLLKSFFDEVPREIDDAAMIDGATRLQIFHRIVLPMVRSGVAATAVLCFIFSWTEFLFSLFLTTSIRTLPVKIATFGSSVSDAVGIIAALGTSAMLPAFVFILLVQKQLVRGLSLGAMKD